MFLDRTSIDSSPLSAAGSLFVPVLQSDLTFENGKGCTNPSLAIAETFPTELGSLRRKLVRAEDDRRYVVLSNSGTRKNAAYNEYLCSRLADECKVPIPPFTFIKQGDQTCFGSRYVCGRIDLFSNSQGKFDAPTLGRQLSAIYAFDQLVANTDRTTHNLLFLTEGDRRVLVEAIDFSEAGYFGESWNTQDLLREGCDSQYAYAHLFENFPFHKESAERVLNRLLQMPSNFISQCQLETPQDWRKAGAFEQAWQQWWRVARFKRIEALFKSLKAT